MQEMWVRSLGQEDALEEEMATHSSILAWGTPRTEKPGWLQSMGSQSQTRLSNYTTQNGISYSYSVLWLVTLFSVNSYLLAVSCEPGVV